MRLWSLHPQYLDGIGLVALWRESLLARAVLQNQTRGYRHHPQLERFRAQEDPIGAIDAYLRPILEEAIVRGYAFDPTKINPTQFNAQIPVSEGQMRYEAEHLRGKLTRRSLERLAALNDLEIPRAHPLFMVVPGDVETWERVAAR